MPRLTLRTLLAYLDDTLEAEEARALGQKIAENPEAQQLIERIKRVTRRRGLGAPPAVTDEDEVSDPNTVAAYLDNNLQADAVKEFEAACLKSDPLLAEVAACHQILTLVLTEPVRVPPSAYQRMYRLLPPPQAQHQRKPGRTLSLTPLPPPAPEYAEVEEPDVALLLGLKRYDASDTWRGRLGLIGALTVCLLLLIVAVWMAWPASPRGSPRFAPSQELAAATGGSSKERPPQPSNSADRASHDQKQDGSKTEPNKGQGSAEPAEEKGAPPPKAPPPKQPEQPGGPPEKLPPKVDGPLTPVPPPAAGREEIGQWERPDPAVLLVHRQNLPDASWLRVMPEEPVLHTNDIIAALPGYKADVRLKGDVYVHLWGNVPQQYAAPQATPLETRLRFHPPIPEVRADLTLEVGRIYISARQRETRVRLRLDDEVWDCVLADDKTEVMVQLHRTFVPGTPFARDGGGEKPRATASLVVIRGQADFHAPKRFKRFDRLAQGTILSWDSISGQLTEPRPLPKSDTTYARFPLLPNEAGMQIQAALNDLASRFQGPDGLRVHLESRMQAPPLPANVLTTIFAIYSYAAIAEGPDASAMAANLFDQLADRNRPYARRAAVTAVSAWLARDLQNTRIFWEVMTGKKQVPEEEADIIVQLLRGYSSRERPDAAAAAEQLVRWLDHPNLVVREAALGNLVAYFDPTIVQRKELIEIPLDQRGEPNYRTYLDSWNKWLEEFKTSLKNPLPQK